MSPLSGMRPSSDHTPALGLPPVPLHSAPPVQGGCPARPFVRARYSVGLSLHLPCSPCGPGPGAACPPAAAAPGNRNHSVPTHTTRRLTRPGEEGPQNRTSVGAIPGCGEEALARSSPTAPAWEGTSRCPFGGETRTRAYKPRFRQVKAMLMESKQDSVGICLQNCHWLGAELEVTDLSFATFSFFTLPMGLGSV